MLEHAVTEKFLTKIGDIVVSFALLEDQLANLVSLFISRDESIIVTTELSFKGLRALVLSLFLQKLGKDSEDFKTVKHFIIRAGKIEEFRNQIVHSIWASSKDSDHITRIKTTAKESKGLQWKFENLSITVLSEYTHSIKKLCGEIQLFYVERAAGKAFLK